MANEASVRGIKKSWSFVSFCKEHGNPNFVDDFKTETGESFCGLSYSADRFNSDEVRTFVDKQTGELRKSNFVTVTLSSKLGTMSGADIAAQKDNLQVVLLNTDAENPNPSFKLCKQGEFEQRGTLLSIV